MKITIEIRIFRQFLFAIALALTVATISQRGHAQEHKAINLSPARGLPFNTSPARRAPMTPAS